MDLLANLSLGFSIALSPYTLMLAIIGCFLGTIIGALPGLGPSNGVAILIPLTFTLGLDATSALVLGRSSATATLTCTRRSYVERRPWMKTFAARRTLTPTTPFALVFPWSLSPPVVRPRRGQRVSKARTRHR